MTDATELNRLITDAARMSGDALIDRFYCAVIDTGGNWLPAKPSTSHLTQIQLHGVSGAGETAAAAIQNWAAAARQRFARIHATEHAQGSHG